MGLTACCQQKKIYIFAFPTHKPFTLIQQSFAAYIKDYTKAEHAQLEKLLIGMIRSIRSPEHYLVLLEMFYGYYHALELKMDQYLTNEKIPDLAERRKSAAILQDIHDLGGLPPAQVLAAAIPRIQSYPQALGAAYVLEGSTLGGVIIARMIREQLQLSTPEGFTFFNGYGHAVQQMWRKFHSYMDAITDDAAREQAANAARETFLKFNDWAKRYESILKV